MDFPKQNPRGFSPSLPTGLVGGNEYCVDPESNKNDFLDDVLENYVVVHKYCKRCRTSYDSRRCPNKHTFSAKSQLLDKCRMKLKELATFDIENHQIDIKQGVDYRKRLLNRCYNTYGTDNVWFTFESKPISLDEAVLIEISGQRISIHPRLPGGGKTERTKPSSRAPKVGKNNKTNPKITVNYSPTNPKVHIEDPGFTTAMYVGSTPIYRDDPHYVESSTVSCIEDSMDKTRFLKTILGRVSARHPLAGNFELPIMSAQPNDTLYIAPKLPSVPSQNFNRIAYYPSPTYVSPDGSVCYVGNTLYMILSSNLYTINFSKYVLTFLGNGLNHFEPTRLTPVAVIDEKEDLDFPDESEAPKDIPHSHMLDIAGLTLHHHLFLKAVSMCIGKNAMTYVLNIFCTDFEKWYRNSVYIHIHKYSVIQIASVLFCHVMKIKQKQVNVDVKENVSMLSNQKDTNQIFVHPPNKNPEQSLFMTIMQKLLPDPFYVYLRDRLEWLKGSVNHQSISDLVGNWASGLFQMKAFPHLKDEISIALEELIKTLPLGGFCIFAIEMYQDVKSGKFNSLRCLQRAVFHCIWELVPFNIIFKLLTLPLRLVIHYYWNKIASINPELVIYNPMLSEKLSQVSDVPYSLSLNGTSYPRYFAQCPVEIQYYKEVHQTLKNYAEVQVNPMRLMSTAVHYHNAQAGGVFVGKSTRNFLYAFQERNCKPYPKERLSQKTKIAFELAGEKLLELLTPHYQKVSFEEWSAKSDKKTMYENAMKALEGNWNNIKYGWSVQLKTNELTFKSKPRTIFAADNSYVVVAGPMVYSLQLAMKYGPLSGRVDLKDVFGLSRSLYILYASVGAPEIEEFFTRAASDPEAFYFAIVGDDSSGVMKHTVLSADMTAFDCSQHQWYHEHWFRNFLPNHLYPDEFDVYLKQYHAKEYTRVVESDEVIELPKRNGLRTGCLETSVSNTLLMATSIGCALKASLANNWPDSIVQYLQDECGFQPKSNVTSLCNGFEFLKRGWIETSEHGVVCVPLLSNFCKLGKSEKSLASLVPGSWWKSDAQMSIDFDLMMLNSMFKFGNNPFTDEIFLFLRKNAWVGEELEYKDVDWMYKLQGKSDKSVTEHDILSFWCARYEITAEDIKDACLDICASLYWRPRIYNNATLSRALDVDYGR